MLTRPHAACLSNAVKPSRSLANRVRRSLSDHRAKQALPSSISSSLPSSPHGRQCRTYATAAEKQINIAVLGGGVTGLASAHFLTQEFPDAQISLFESKEELGGWVKSRKVKVPGGEVIFESGPRSLRPAPPAGTLALKLIQDLGMVDDLLITSKSAAAAQNRFIFYPDHLVRMPGPGQNIFEALRNIWSEPVFNGIFAGALKEFRTAKRPDSLIDESVGDFLTRRVDKRIADNLASALFHGIYAGDIYQLSAKSILPIPWMREGKHGNMVTAAVQAMTEKTSWNFCDDIALQTKLQDTVWEPKLRDQIGDASVFTFKQGLGEITKQLERRLAINKHKVRLLPSTTVTNLEKGKDSSDITLTYDRKPTASSDHIENKPQKFTHVISTLSPSITHSLFSNEIKSDRSTTSMHRPLSYTMNSTPAVTVCVVNLYFSTPNLLRTITPPGGLPPSLSSLQGFGYLLPRSLPFEQNPERALGVIFDSDISPDVETSVTPDKIGTRLTVMLGGHWWDGWTSFPTDAEAEDLATNVLARHLGILEAPVAVRTTLQKNCIPQYTVGHTQRMSEAHTGLLDAFNGRLRVAGSWYHGVGVNDCLRSAFECVQGLAQEVHEGILGKNEDGDREARTGLEKFKWGRPLALVKRERIGELDVIDVEESAVTQGYFEGRGKQEKKGREE